MSIVASTLLLASQMVTVPAAVAQNISGSLRGTVSDKTGAVLPRGEATLTNTDTSVTYRIDVNGRGEYSFPSVPPGNYKLVVTAEGLLRRPSIMW